NSPTAKAVVMGGGRMGEAERGGGVGGGGGGGVGAVVAGGIGGVGGIISAVIVRACKRAADDGPDGEAAEGRSPPAPSGICRGRRRQRRDTDRCRRGNS